MSTVKAWAAMKAGDELKPFEYELDALSAGEVDVKVTSCGICHSDVSMIENEWRNAQYPLVPGHEIIGTVESVGDGVTHIKPGDTVGIGWMSGSCLSCQTCMSGSQHHCRNSQATIVGHHGGFADKVRAQAAWAIKLPDGLDALKAGPLFCGGVTVFTPIVDYGIQPTDKVGVIGIGGLGHLAVKFLAAWGCEVTAFTTSMDKEAELKELGAHKVVNTRDEGALKALRGTYDAVISTVNVDLPWGQYIGALAPRGRLITVGMVMKPMEVRAGQLITGQKAVGGSDTGSPAMITKMLEFCARHDILPETEVFAMDDVNDALARLKSGKARYRVVLEA
ncbi:NADPH-dependent aldehyde reductase Ahr [Robiginitomaculum antarcticum]|uniref:NADPH-dependent aldehyde reductase Ahr n=1 Tax=Robiginitomaculum antarcticum TaxID=437507 RepID=UPI00039C6FE9|nr:NAD(P)-dependent alcohol dehydrogenase [Robiginitomaculum antarcticum]